MSSFLSVVFFVGIVLLELLALLALRSHAGSREDKRAALVIVAAAFTSIGALSLWLNPIRGSIYEESLDLVKWFIMGNMIILTGMVIWAYVAANLMTQCGTTPTSH